MAEITNEMDLVLLVFFRFRITGIYVRLDTEQSLT